MTEKRTMERRRRKDDDDEREREREGENFFLFARKKREREREREHRIVTRISSYSTRFTNVLVFFGPIEPTLLRELMNSGYCVIDNFMQDESVAKKMREEMCSMPIRYENDEEERKGEKDDHA